MYRRHAILACLALVAGCQSHTKPIEQPVATEGEFEAVAASALVFDPPVTLDEPELALSRAEREPSVSIGYEELTTEYFSIRLDDRQISNGFGFGRFGGTGSYDSYERRAVSHRIGVRYR